MEEADHGPGQGQDCTVEEDEHGLAFRLNFRVTQAAPLKSAGPYVSASRSHISPSYQRTVLPRWSSQEQTRTVPYKDPERARQDSRERARRKRLLPGVKEKQAAAAREKRAADPKKARAIELKSSRKNSAQRAAYTSEWRKTNADRVQAYSQQYRKANLAAVKEKERAYRAEKPHIRAALEAGRRARKRGALGKWSEAEWLAVLEMYGHRCRNCAASEGLTFDHIEPLARGGTNWIDNIQPLCKSCNSQKNARLWPWL